MSRSPRHRRLLWIAVLLLPTVGCVRGCTSSRPPIHINPSMYLQPKYLPQSQSKFFYDGATMRAPVPGTVPRTAEPLELRTSPEYNTGKDAAGNFVASAPVPVTDEQVARGRERFGIYCAPCHDARGTGRGILFERGNVPTADLHQERLRDAPDGQLFDTITNGLGLMPSYRWPIPVEDRWAIVAYVRQLQQEQAPSRETRNTRGGP